MLADGCEAALRAMNISASDKEALETISNIIYSRKKDGQLDDSNLSKGCLLYTSPSPRDRQKSRMPSSA